MSQDTASSAKPPRPLQAQAERLANLLTLEKHFRQAETVESIAFLLVNEARIVALYRNALLWRNGRIAAISDIPSPTPNAPFTLWARDVCRHFSAQPSLRYVTSQDVPPKLAEAWAEFLPAHGLWLPLSEGSAVFFAREKPWHPAEYELLKHAADAASHAMDACEKQSPSLGRLLKERLPFHTLSRKQKRAYALIGCACLLFPLRISVVAPAEVSARNMFVVRAPVNGVIREVVATPNNPVQKGDVLLVLDDQEWQSKRHIALQALAVARSEYTGAQQAAITNSEAQATLHILARRVEQREAELQQIEAILERLTITTDRHGIALIADANALRGKPVQIGEKIMSVANAHEARIEAWIPVADSITLPPQADMAFYLNTAPHRAIHAKVESVSYQATLSPAGVLAFRTTARIDAPADDLPRLGLHGTAKIYGNHVPLFYYFLRKPLTVLGKWLGW